MVYKKHRVSTTKIVLSLALMFLIGFFTSYTIGNVQQRFSKQESVQQSPPITAESITGTKLSTTTTTAQATTKIVAVNPQGDGVMGDVMVEIEPGEGKVLVNTNPFVEPDTQQSAVTAVEVAKQVAHQDLKDKNVIIDFNVNGTVVGGPSAGAAMTIATISAIENKPIKNGIVITGTIEQDGTIGKVGGIVEKGDAAVENNYKTLLIPQGQNILTYYDRQTTQRQVGGFVFYNTKLVPKTVNLQEYFKDKGLNVIEVSNIQDAMSYTF